MCRTYDGQGIRVTYKRNPDANKTVRTHLFFFQYIKRSGIIADTEPLSSTFANDNSQPCKSAENRYEEGITKINSIIAGTVFEI
jgi:hypothetical protein